MTRLELFLCRYYLPKLLSRGCGNEIPRAGKAGENVNCFSLNLDNADGTPFFWLRSIVGDELRGFEWDGQRFSIDRSIKLVTVEAKNFSIRHFYGLTEIRYSGIVDLAIYRATGWPYIKINVFRVLDRLDHYRFNKKKLVTKQRIDLLKLLVQKHLEGNTSIHSLNLMTDLYSIKWVNHPDADTQQRTVELYLDSLVESGELSKDVRDDYSVSGKAIRTIERYEEDERRHTQNVKMQRLMAWLTLLIALLAVIQAGLIKLPAIIEYSSPPSQSGLGTSYNVPVNS